MRAAPVDTPLLERVDDLLKANALATERCWRLMNDLRAREPIDFTMLSVALREIRGLRQVAAPQSAATATGEAQPRKGIGGELVVVSANSGSPPMQRHH